MDNDLNLETEWITELGKARSDEYTEKILAFIQELEKSAPEPFLPLLTDLAFGPHSDRAPGHLLRTGTRDGRGAGRFRKHARTDEAAARKDEISQRTSPAMKRLISLLALFMAFGVAAGQLTGCKRTPPPPTEQDAIAVWKNISRGPHLQDLVTLKKTNGQMEKVNGTETYIFTTAVRLQVEQIQLVGEDG